MWQRATLDIFCAFYSSTNLTLKANQKTLKSKKHLTTKSVTSFKSLLHLQKYLTITIFFEQMLKNFFGNQCNYADIGKHILAKSLKLYFIRYIT